MRANPPPPAFDAALRPTPTRADASAQPCYPDSRMPAAHLSRKTLNDLKRRHIAFLEERLVSEAAREDWIRAVRDGYDEFLALPLRDVVDPAAMERGLHEALTADSVRAFFAPLLRDLHRRVLSSLGEDETPLGDHVPPKARHAIDALLDRRDLIPDALVRKVFEQKVIEDAIHDTLYEALTQFTTTVNPFFAEWGLPAILKRMPIGGGLILSSMESMRAEFDRRLEPEIRKFLGAFSRRARGELTELFLTRSGDPRFVELRKNVVAFLYSRSLSELLEGFDDEAADTATTAVEHIVIGLLGQDRSGHGLGRELRRFLDECGDQTVGEWMRAAGVSGDPAAEAWAALLWPHVERTLRGPVVRDLLGRLTAEFYDGLAAT